MKNTLLNKLWLLLLLTLWTGVAQALTPVISTLEPTVGHPDGGTHVGINGSNFVAGATVRFGTVVAAATVVHSGRINAVAPAHAVGIVTVYVTNPNNKSGSKVNGFTYTYPAPTVSSVSPASGFTKGGEEVTITGSNFRAGAVVRFGGKTGTGVVVVSGSQIKVKTPSHTKTETVTVTVTNSDGKVGTRTNAYTYNHVYGCSRIANNCVEGPSTKCIVPTDGGACVNVYRTCWNYRETYSCYTDQITNSCSTTDLQGCTLLRTVVTATAPDGSPTGWSAQYECSDTWSVYCENAAANLFCNGNPNCDLSRFDCRKKSTTVLEGGATKNIDGVDVYKNPWKTRDYWECYTGDKSTSCSRPDLSQCTKSGQTCTLRDPVDGRCIKWEDRYVCETTTVCNSEGIDPEDCNDPYKNQCLEYQDGVCIKRSMERLCYGEPPEICNDNANCELSGTECVSWDNGMCDQQRQIYTCQNVTEMCTVEESVQSCEGGDITRGTNNFEDELPSGGFGEVAGWLAIMDEMQRTMQEGNITVFPGKYLKCDKPRLSGFLTNNCCKTSLTDEGDNFFLTCSEKEIELAASRRANRTHYLGSWCSSRGLFGICLQNSQGYCSFPSVLSKLIQQQGREQLADLAVSGYGEAVKTNYSWSLFSSSDTESWLPVVIANGNKVHFWQWPKFCATPELTQQAIADGKSAHGCPFEREAWVASCALSECGNLPTDPRRRDGDPRWQLQTIDPNKHETTAVSKYVVVTGSCNTANTCAYVVAGWPAGDGGQAQVTVEMSWPLYSFTQTGWTGRRLAIGEYILEAYAYLQGTQNAQPKVRMAFANESTEGEMAWTEIPLGNPIIGTDTKTNTTPQLTVFGGCDPDYHFCEYRFTGPVAVEAKPWGTAQNGDCSGFTVSQLSVMDFSAMNLGEWLASEEFKMPSSSELIDQIPEDINSFYDTYTKSESTPVPQPSNLKALRVTPTEIVSQTAVNLEAIGYWPFVGQGNDNKVSNVHVDWGDGTTVNISGSAMGTDSLLRASHTYAKPEQDGTIVVRATFTAQDGQHVVTSNISAFRDTATPTTQKQGGGLIESTSGTVPSMFPGGADGNSVPK